MGKWSRERVKNKASTYQALRAFWESIRAVDPRKINNYKRKSKYGEWME